MNAVSTEKGSKQVTTVATRAGAQTGAELLVKSLEKQGVEYVFGIPGAKIDKVFDTLSDSKIKTIVCRHEQNAAFIAAGIGRLTGKAGVALVTSGPGCSNLATGLATATSEGDPVVAIGGAVPISQRLKHVHQTMDTVSLFRPVTKFSAEIDSGAAVSEVVANAFRIAESGRPGASFISAPQDVMTGETESRVLTPVYPVAFGPADAESVKTAASVINGAQCPVLLLGMLASQPSAATAIRQLVGRTKLAVVCTYQGAGVISQELFDCFGGRVGLFHNQPGDKLLDAADVVITIGYDPVEYDPSLWNHGFKRDIIHVDVLASDIDKDYKPAIELTGDISATVGALTNLVVPRTRGKKMVFLGEIAQQRKEFARYAMGLYGSPIHPARLAWELQSFLDEDTTVCLDMGSFHIWLARHLHSFRPRQVLMTNGQQTLGVGLPWGIAASLVRPNEKIISISGDGGFLFSAMELETAVRLNCNLVHLVWIDGHYDMVRFQEVAKYGRSSGVDFGPVDFVKLAESYGAAGLKIDHPDEIAPTLNKALAIEGPVVVAIPVDYRDNHRLLEVLRPDVLN